MSKEVNKQSETGFLLHVQCEQRQTSQRRACERGPYLVSGGIHLAFLLLVLLVGPGVHGQSLLPPAKRPHIQRQRKQQTRQSFLQLYLYHQDNEVHDPDLLTDRKEHSSTTTLNPTLSIRDKLYSAFNLLSGTVQTCKSNLYLNHLWC